MDLTDFNELGNINLKVKEEDEDFDSLADMVDEIDSEIEDSSEDCEIISYELFEGKPLTNHETISSRNQPKQTNVISFFLTDKDGKKLPPTFIPEPPPVNGKRKRKAESNTTKKSVTLIKRDPVSSVNKKTCPDHKRIPGTQFTVDAFSYGVIPNCKAYFLSHFHADHYMGLSKKFSSDLYCTQTTANLVLNKIRVNSINIHPLILDITHTIQGVDVVLLDANHCPGSVIFKFTTPDGKHYIHTGDFRGHSKMESFPCLSGLYVDTLFLDTTYMNPVYTFPPQDDVINHAITLCKNALKSDPNTLILVGSYLVGKERMYLGIAQALDCKICVNKSKFNLLQCYDWPELKERITTDSRTSKLHVVKISVLSLHEIREYRDRFPSYSSVIAIRPTGWAYKKNQELTKIKPNKFYNILIYDLPYSEHSSYNELRRFVKFLNPQHVVPTVNTQDSRNMKTVFDMWLSGKNQLS
ncbi:hypothetical protein LOD99_8964 [Oopsacas minuta]|uniref:DNA cross-link repair 1A protein n=1 Tax=Oopsacas minuta TaxID=111878 RepID=A0AAV7JE11_9METZ|nr:hypothetical protein LOD99_8964 [Oopsacas minuta]